MRVGTPNFIGDRLREAREMRRMSGPQLAELVGVSRQAISHYEGGAQTPSPDVLRRLADVLRFPMHRFTLPRPPVTGGATFWRSLHSATKAERLRSKHRLKELAGLCSVVEQSVELPRVNFPDLGLPAEPEKLSDESIELAAERTRRHWGLGDGPISNVVWLLENHGAIVARHFLDAPKLDAFSRWVNVTTGGRPIVVLGTEKASACRSRFDAAHELGHLVLHRHVREDEVSVDRFELIEAQAHAFARAFLLPAKSFVSEVRAVALDAFRSMKIRWRVSIQAMIERTYRLGLIPEDRRTSLWINLTRRGWRQSEPLDDMLEPEQPRVLSRSIDMLVGHGIFNRESMEMLTGLYAWEIAEVAGIPESMLDRDHAPLRLIPKDQPVQSGWRDKTGESWTLPLHRKEGAG